MLRVAQISDRQSWRMQATNSPDLAFRLIGETVDWYQRVYKQNFKTDGTRLSAGPRTIASMSGTNDRVN